VFQRFPNYFAVGVLMLSSAFGNLVHACTQASALPVYEEATPLLGGAKCPNGSIAALFACSEAQWVSKGGEAQRGPLVLDYLHLAVGGGFFHWHTLDNGQWVATFHQFTPGQDCPPIERNLGAKACKAQGGPCATIR
jgi:hypothetical protein